MCVRERKRGVIKGRERERKGRSERVRKGGRLYYVYIFDCLHRERKGMRERERDYTLRKHSIAYPTD